MPPRSRQSVKSRREGGKEIRISPADSTTDADDLAEAKNSSLWTPSVYTAFKLLLSLRLCSAVWSHISDCDEVYNYWEPMHFLLYGKGFQTWEYSPQYAIRSYAYLWLHAIPCYIYGAFLQSNKILVFYFLRCLFAFCCALCEVYFFR
ncbi:alpha-1,2-mannosyltransferase ALG9 [Trichonephila clavata]|uniref:Mannosyltransferase n=1 Tax=Trichonephila clavata TaxID=2740835 RepID=A0A8X6L254_TRICU|nr:alpha-1,2-mannosyltransferase ALG9 [Trichonephila clavata]